MTGILVVEGLTDAFFFQEILGKLYLADTRREYEGLPGRRNIPTGALSCQKYRHKKGNEASNHRSYHAHPYGDHPAFQRVESGVNIRPHGTHFRQDGTHFHPDGTHFACKPWTSSRSSSTTPSRRSILGSLVMPFILPRLRLAGLREYRSQSKGPTPAWLVLETRHSHDAMLISTSIVSLPI